MNMFDRSSLLLSVLALLLALWLILGFWPLSVTGQWVLSLVAVAVAGVALWRQWYHLQSCRDALSHLSSAHLPPDDFQGHVLLVVGDTAPWFTCGQPCRETRQGWYLQVESPEQLPELAQQLATVRPALLPQVAILLALTPEHHLSDEAFGQTLRAWQRVIAQCRPWLSGLPPVLVTLTVSGPSQTDGPDDDAAVDNTDINSTLARWFTVTPDLPGVRVWLSGQGSVSVADWLQESPAGARLSRLCEAFWLDALQAWSVHTVDAQLTTYQGDLLALHPVAVGFCLTPMTAAPSNLWQQHISALTALPPSAGTRQGILPLPEMLLGSLPHHRGLSRYQQLWRQAGLMVGLFLLLAMLASFVNNQRLVRSVGDHLALYHSLEGHPPAPKQQAQQRLQADSHQLDDWLRRGEPLRYGLGLYQGPRLSGPVDAALSDWTSLPSLPSLPRPVVQRAVQVPKTVRLGSLSLFDSGMHQLKAGSTNVLVNALVDIKVKPGWLIVVSGHTDNAGDPQLNQSLSQKRAEAVRAWMRDTGGIPESCFAVQGLGESRPVATNDTPAGRALNRRVEISLVPQVDACRVPGAIPAPSQDDGASIVEMEK